MSRSGLFAMYNNNTDAFSTAASIYYGLDGHMYQSEWSVQI